VLGTFPIPHHDELFYGVLCRLNERLGGLTAEQLHAATTGKRGISLGILRATNLEKLIPHLPPRHPLIAAAIVENHTLAPFLDAFRPTDFSNPREKIPEHLFSCPACREDDMQSVGEAYWHRSHQIPGGTICYRHGKTLQQSTRTCHTNYAAGRAKLDYFSPSDETAWNDLTSPTGNNLQVYERFHQRVQSLLHAGQRQYPGHSNTLIAAAMNRGFFRGTKLRSEKLWNAIVNEMGEELPRALFQMPGRTAVATLTEILRGTDGNPFRTLLLYDVLDVAIGESIEMVAPIQKVGRPRTDRCYSRR
jgi:hypothetical protein